MSDAAAASDGFFGGGVDSPTRAHYQNVYESVRVGEAIALPPYVSYSLRTDPKRLGFVFARHKFVAKMLDGFAHVLEAGCGDGFTALLTAPSVGRVTAVDFFKAHLEWAETYVKPYAPNVTFEGCDLVEGPIPRAPFDGAYSLDVLEHIDPSQEEAYMRNVAGALRPNGVFILGMPSLESQDYASPASKAGHVNCKTGPDLKALCERFFRNVFLFGMNDEVLHTGFAPMCHYRLALCVGPCAGEDGVSPISA